MKRYFLTFGLFAVALAACGANGQNGQDGKNGKDGASCTFTTNSDGTTTITCPDGSSFTVKNGEKGQKGDADSDGNNGQNGTYCQLVENIDGSQAVVCPADGTSYIVRGNVDHYTNYCLPGSFGPNCQPCTCNEHQDCNDGVTGDGSCTCKPHRTGQDCADCEEGFTGSLCIKITCNINNGQVNDETGSCSSCNYGYLGGNCDIEASCVNGTAKFGPTADGHCSSCWNGWFGQDCDVCPTNYIYDSNSGLCADCAGNYYGIKCDKTYCGSVTDLDGNTYNTIIINGQEWMAENYRRKTGTYYYPNNNNNSVSAYGLLYDWETAVSYKFCPSGWRLPDEYDFNHLLEYVTNNRTATNNFLSLIKNYSTWTKYSNQGIDDFGFSALPAGYYAGSYYTNFGNYGIWWSSTKYSGSEAYSLGLGNGSARIYKVHETYGNSVRCVKDAN